MSKPYDPRDAFYRKAQKQRLRARSAFKKPRRGGSGVIDRVRSPSTRGCEGRSVGA